MKKKDKDYCLPERSPVTFHISHVHTEANGLFDKPPQHIHNECELYIHLGGNVAFMVEDQLYSLEPGSIIITRPGEYHHCVYYSDLNHHFYWMLIKADEQLLPAFFNRPKGTGNKIDLDAAAFLKVKQLCERLTEEDGDLIQTEAKLWDLLATVQSGKQVTPKNDLPQDVARTLTYIKNHLDSSVTVSEMAKNAFISVNTLERHFADSLQMTPLEYLRRVRLSKAEELLRSDLSVGQIADACGFSDYSHFIAVFKQHYGLTPLQYRKEIFKGK